MRRVYNNRSKHAKWFVKNVPVGTFFTNYFSNFEHCPLNTLTLLYYIKLLFLVRQQLFSLAQNLFGLYFEGVEETRLRSDCIFVQFNQAPSNALEVYFQIILQANSDHDTVRHGSRKTKGFGNGFGEPLC